MLARPRELQRVVEEDVFTNGLAEVLLNPLPNYIDLVPAIVHDGQVDKVGVVSQEVVKKPGHFAGPSLSVVAPAMFCSAIQRSDRIAVPDILLAAREGFVANVAVILCLEPQLHQVADLERLLVIFGLRCFVPELQHVLQERVDAPLRDAVIESSLELPEDLDDCVNYREPRLKILVKRLVDAHGIVVPGRSKHPL